MRETSADASLISFRELSAILALALGLRAAFYNGPFGSDDLVYLNRAVEIANGIWSTANYNGALRYGFNIPAGMAMRVFGVSEFSANLWPMLCSLGEVALVYGFAAQYWGRAAAIASALALAILPLHVAVATRIHADPVFCFFVTLSFVLFFAGEQSGSRVKFFFAGLAMGAAFWVKEVGVVVLFGLILYPVIARRFDLRWLLVVLGGAMMLAAHCALMYAIAGDPLHLLKVVTGQVSRNFIAAAQGEDSPGFYLRYLFLDLRHTWIMAFLALAGAYSVVRGPDVGRGSAGRYVIFWLASALLVLSVLPVSLHPMRFVMKQSNYLTLFLAPLALLCGWQMSKLNARGRIAVGAVGIVGAIGLCGLEQQAYRVFSANSRAAIEMSKADAEAVFYGSTQNVNLARMYSVLDDDPSMAHRWMYLSDALSGSSSSDSNHIARSRVVIDEETMKWGASAFDSAVPRRCWIEPRLLAPVGLGVGAMFVGVLGRIASTIPGMIGQRIQGPLRRITVPLAGRVYDVSGADVTCAAR